jgi:protein-tyrosine phosphatase
MNAKAGILQEVTWQDSGTHTMLHFPPNVQRLHHEVALLKHYNVSVVISLLEQPLDQTALEAYFEVYHLPVEDVTPPSYEQVYAFADILYTTLAAGKNVVTHCLAGVGRTTTMLLAAALVQGHTWEELVTWVQTCNPHFQFKGCQVAFLQALAQDITNGRRPLRSAAQEMYRCQ